MEDLSALTKRILVFRDERNWKQYHTPKDMFISLMLEVAELGEHFQWKSEQELDALSSEEREQIGEELADIFYWTLLIASDNGIDLKDAFLRKMELNEKKYPVDKARDNAAKYTNY